MKYFNKEKYKILYAFQSIKTIFFGIVIVISLSMVSTSEITKENSKTINDVNKTYEIEINLGYNHEKNITIISNKNKPEEHINEIIISNNKKNYANNNIKDLKNKSLNRLNSKNTTSQINSNISMSNSSLVTSDDILNIIADQTENIKNEICSSCVEIDTNLNILIEEIKNIKRKVKKIGNNEEKSSNKTDTTTINQDINIETYSELLNCINKLNYIKADLFKLNEMLDTLQKANCKNFPDNSNKYSLVVNSSNKLLEEIQNLFHKLNININLVVLN